MKMTTSGIKPRSVNGMRMPFADKRVFGVLFFSLFATITGVGIVVPLLPAYADRMGASGLYIGLIFGAFSLSRTIFLPFFGRRSDRSGRKPFIVTGLFAYTLISIWFYMTSGVEQLIVVRLVQGVASAMIMPVCQAYIGDLTPPGREGATMGIFQISMFLGLGFGPVLGGFIHDGFGFRAAFVGMGILAFCGFLLSFFLLPPVRRERLRQKPRDPWPWRRIIRDHEVIALFLFRLTYMACIGIVWGFLPVLATGRFGLSSTQTGILVMLGVVVSGVMHPSLGGLADRMDRRVLVIAGGLIAALSILSYAWATGFWYLVAANILFGIGGGISMPALMAMSVTRGEQIQAMGSLMSLLTMGHSFGMFLGAMIGGLAMDMLSLGWAFPLGTMILIIGTACFGVLTCSDQANS